MSDISRGEGWWQASDRKWYPPEQHPERGVEPETAPEPPADAESPSEPEPSAPTSPRSATPWIVAAIVVVAMVAVGAFVLFNRGDDKRDAATVAPSDASSTNSSSSGSSSADLTEAQVRALLLAPKDFGTDLEAAAFAPNAEATLPCGTPNPDRATPPKLDVGIAAHAKSGRDVQEEIVVYDSDRSTATAFADVVRGYSCSQGTLPVANSGSSSTALPIQFTKVDRTRDLAAAEAVEIDFTANGFHGQLFFVRTPPGVVALSFTALDSVDGSTVPDPLAIVRRALAQLPG